jgi:molybdate transport system ATP-binding protein
MTLDAHVVASRGTLHLDVALSAADGEAVAVLGPNGAGKSTLLRALAGLLPLAAGHVTLDGDDLDRPAGGLFRAPEHRSVALVFQDYLLFPHLTVLENVAFGLRSRGMRHRDARALAHRWLARVDLQDLAEELPSALSGGQAQRVALARALAVEPRLLLLDEPLAALDAVTRPGVRRELREHLAAVGGVRVLVTHDPVDAMVLADRIVVLEDGSVTQEGTAVEISRQPRTAYVADLMGTNLFHGRLDATGRVHVDEGFDLVAATDLPAGAAFASVRPTAVALHRTRPDGTPRNVWPATVDSLEVHGERVRVYVAGPLPLVAEVTGAAVAALSVEPGTRVWVAVKATDVAVYR